MRAKCILYSQHQKGKYNVIANILSYWYFISDIKLTLFLKSTDANELLSLTTSKCDILMDYMHTGEVARYDSIQDKTHKDRDRAW